MTQTTRPCVMCGITLHRTKPVGDIQTWCSPKCRSELQKVGRLDRVLAAMQCLTCGTPIGVVARPTRVPKYCSDDCKPRCTIDGCDDPAHSRDWCHAHYGRWYRTGDPLTPVTRARNDGLACKVDDCDEPRRKRGWCGAHYAAWRACGDPLGRSYTWAKQSEACRACGAPASMPGLREYCSYACWAATARARTVGHETPPTSVPCGACGDLIDVARRNGRRTRRSDTLTCRPCVYQMRQYGISARELANERGIACGICGLDVDMTLRKPDVMRASVDHVVPVARGGTNERTNLQLAHLRCNMRKGARVSS